MLKKGWGIITLEDLPANAFVFEFVDEVLTNVGLMRRIEGRISNGECIGHYAMHLDAD
jgi:hypothetical protein